jgi:hypothetical protein
VERGVPPKEGADVASLRAVMQAIEGCVTQALATPADPRLRGLAILVEALGVRKSREDTVTFLTAALMCMVWPGVSWQGTARLRHACRDADRKVRDYTMLLNQTVAMGKNRTPAEAHLLVRCTCSTVPKTVIWGYSFAARTRCKNNLPHGRAFFWDRRSYSPTLNP